MKKFLVEQELKVLSLLVMVAGVTVWWVPSLPGFDSLYSATQWLVSYRLGFVRRGLVGTILGNFFPQVGMNVIYHAGLAIYCVLVAVTLTIFYRLLRFKDKNSVLFRAMMLILATPATLSFLARWIGSFDQINLLVSVLCLVALSTERLLWSIPVMMAAAMLVHEGFLAMFAPTLLAAIVFKYLAGGRERRFKILFICCFAAVWASFALLYAFDVPHRFPDLFAALQSRATFIVPEMAARELCFRLRDHFAFASSYFSEPAYIISLAASLVVLSPLLMIIARFWVRFLKRHGGDGRLFTLLPQATLTPFALTVFAIDVGRWISAFFLCNVLLFFFLVANDGVDVDELTEFSAPSISLPFLALIALYLFIGPFHTVYPYPFREDFVVSFVAVSSAILMDVSLYLRWRTPSLRWEPA
jgi:hypothetical protein